MNAGTCFALLPSGDRLNLSTTLSVNFQKKKLDQIEQRLSAYREHYRTNEVSVPETNVKDLGLLLQRLSFKPPAKFIQYSESKHDEKTIEYDVDEEDLEWLTAANENRIKNSIQEISIDKFEFAIDRMEKCCKFEPQSTAQCADDEEVDDVCCVCADGDVSNANQIIYCDMCNIAVHQDCYGVPYIPEGSWLCRRCKLSPSAPVQCCLCPNPFGAFKPTSDGRWAHVVCAIWLNEVHFGNAVFLEPVEGCRETLKLRKALRCLYCREKHGACLQCSSRSCFKAFHVTCAQQLGLVMKVETVHDKNNGEEVDVKRFVYCQKHAVGNNMSKKEIENSIRNARRNLEASGACKPTITLPSISRENVDRIQKETEIERFEDVVVYWYQKRRSRAGVPLIRRLNVEVVPKERRHVTSNVYDGMTEEEKKTCDLFRLIRNSLETTRLLSEQIKKREINKKTHMSVCRTMFESSLVPIGVLLLDAWKKLKSKDTKLVFAEPVKLDGYLTIIKHPMDLSTIQKKIDTAKYGSINDLRKDVLLMTDNCSKFNHDNDYFLKYGRKYRKQAIEILDDAENRFKQAEGLQSSKDVKLLKMFIDEFTDHKEGKKLLDDDQHIDQPSTSKETPNSNNRKLKKAATTVSSPPVLFAPSPIEQDEQDERMENEGLLVTSAAIAPAREIASSWKALFNGNQTSTTGSQKRKNMAAPATTPKRKRDGIAAQSILPFLNSSVKKADEPLTFASVVRNGQPMPGLTLKSSQSALIGRLSSSAAATMIRHNDGVQSPMPADTASSTECSTDEESLMLGNETPSTTTTKTPTKSAKKKVNGTTKLGEKKKLAKNRNTMPKENPIEKAKNELKSIFAHNAIVNVDGKAAKVIDTQLAHVLDIPREQRHNMLISKPGRNNGSTQSKKLNGSSPFTDDDKQLVYVEFFQKSNNSEQYKWVSSERVTLIDLSNTNKSKIVGWKAAKEWQQNIMNKS